MPGVNTEIAQAGVKFHVQTQDQGMGSHYVESIIYRSGKVISSRRTYYTSVLSNPDLHERINEIIKEQHALILKDVSSGRFDHL